MSVPQELGQQLEKLKKVLGEKDRYVLGKLLEALCEVGFDPGVLVNELSRFAVRKGYVLDGKTGNYISDASGDSLEDALIIDSENFLQRVKRNQQDIYRLSSLTAIQFVSALYWKNPDAQYYTTLVELASRSEEISDELATAGLSGWRISAGNN